MQITRRMALSAALVSLWLQALPAAAADTATAAQRTVVYHIDDSQRAIPMIRSVGNHRRADADIRIIVVALSAGVDFLVEGAADDRGNTYDALVDPLMLDGVEFRVCGNTLTGRQIDAASLLPDVTVVPSGVAEIARLQIEEGAAYIKP
jgi:intracellular sulfur oxidation DsrE/DsrF family protein